MGYSCQILANEVINWIEKEDQEKPFFVFAAFHEPHKKVASPPELVRKYADHPVKDAEYMANIENLDSAVGKICSYLDENNLIDNTILIFLSDNGSYRQPSNGGLRAVKSYLYDGGIRVPGIIHWPSHITKNQVIAEPVGFVDIMPTICDILEIEPPNQTDLDGTSILGLLNGQNFERAKPLYWYFYRTSPEIAMRIDDVMILGKDEDTIPRTHRFSKPDMDYIKNMNLREYELYDLVNDKGQHENIIDTHPKSKLFEKLINEKLNEIQVHGYYWDTLPEPSGIKRVKTNWVSYSLQ
jgi:arylsulfatase A